MAGSYQDLNVAFAALHDPATPAADLADIAQLHPQLFDAIAAHPQVYPGLLAWMQENGRIPAAAPTQVIAAQPAQYEPQAA